MLKKFYKIKQISSHNFFLYLNIFPLIFATAVSLTIPFLFKFLPQKLPLFYSLQWGEKQLATHAQLFIIPAGIILITLLNILISLNLHSSQNFFKIILFCGSLVSTIILTIAFIKTVTIFI
jgi:hypothetical protein